MSNNLKLDIIPYSKFLAGENEYELEKGWTLDSLQLYLIEGQKLFNKKLDFAINIKNGIPYIVPPLNIDSFNKKYILIGKRIINYE